MIPSWIKELTHRRSGQLFTHNTQPISQWVASCHLLISSRYISKRHSISWNLPHTVAYTCHGFSDGCPSEVIVSRSRITQGWHLSSCAASTASEVNILWTHTHNKNMSAWWQPNHFIAAFHTGQPQPSVVNKVSKMNHVSYLFSMLSWLFVGTVRCHLWKINILGFPRISMEDSILSKNRYE